MSPPAGSQQIVAYRTQDLTAALAVRVEHDLVRRPRVPAGAPVSVARPRPRPKGTTAPGKPAPCGSRASPDPGRRPSTRRTVRPRRAPGAGGTRRQPSPARPAVAGYGISPRSRCGLPEPRHCIGKRGRPVHNPEPDIAGFAPQRSGPPRPAPALGTGRFRCYTADRVDSFVGHVPLFPRDSATRGGFPLSPSGTGEPAPRIARGAGAGGESPPEPRRPPLFNLDTTRRTLRHPRGPVQSSPRPAVRDAPGAHGPPVAAVARHPSAAVPGETVVAVCLTHGCYPPLPSGLVSTAAGGNPRPAATL